MKNSEKHLLPLQRNVSQHWVSRCNKLLSFLRKSPFSYAFIRRYAVLIECTVQKYMREELPFPDKVLQTLHNLCATAADLARKEEVARLLQKDPYEIESIIDRYKSEGFAESFVDNEAKRYYLNGRGIIKVCSLFT